MINPALPLSLGRVAIGAGSFAAPEPMLKAFLLDPARNVQAPYLMRLFATRELVLGMATLASLRSGRKGWILAGIAVDAADAVAGYLAGSTGQVEQKQAKTLAGIAGGAALAGVIALGFRSPQRAA